MSCCKSVGSVISGEMSRINDSGGVGSAVDVTVDGGCASVSVANANGCRYESFFSLAAVSMRASDIRDMFALTEVGDVISFAGGFPTPEAFPVERATELMTRVACTKPQASLQYGPTEGIVRTAIADHNHLARERLKQSLLSYLAVNVRQGR